MNEITLKDAIQELEELSTGNWVPYEYSPEDAKLILNHINNLQSKIDKAIEYIEENIDLDMDDFTKIDIGCEILKILDLDKYNEFLKEE